MHPDLSAQLAAAAFLPTMSIVGLDTGADRVKNAFLAAVSTSTLLTAAITTAKRAIGARSQESVRQQALWIVAMEDGVRTDLSAQVRDAEERDPEAFQPLNYHLCAMIFPFFLFLNRISSRYSEFFRGEFRDA